MACWCQCGLGASRPGGGRKEHVRPQPAVPTGGTDFLPTSIPSTFQSLIRWSVHNRHVRACLSKGIANVHVHLVLNLVPERFHDFFVLPFPQNIRDRRRWLLQLDHLSHGDPLSCRSHHSPSASVTSKPLDQTTRSLNSGSDVPSSSLTSFKNFHPLPFQPRL